ncbi:hypothetical protein BH23PLA1_BH23PLA1_18210 [soil metagenome]
MVTALIVEDDPDQAELAASFLRLRDLKSILAADGQTALELARTRHFDVILLDLMLPDIDGYEVCRRLRADRELLSTPVVMLTALNGEEQRRHGFRVGANVYLTKPYGAHELFDAIAAALRWQDDMLSERMQGEIHVELHSATRFLREVNHFLVDLYRYTPLTAEQIQQLQQAVLEIGQNAIEWGNRQRIEDLVHLTYRVYEDRIEIVIQDQGPGFNRNDLPHAASYDDPLAHMDVREQLGLREGGFGLLISRGMVDELRYNDAGNQVTLIKRFPSDGVPAPQPEPPR